MIHINKLIVTALLIMSVLGASAQIEKLIEKSIGYNTLLLQMRESNTITMLADDMNADFMQSDVAGEALIKSYYIPKKETILSLVFKYDKNYQFERMCKRVAEIHFTDENILPKLITYLKNRSTFNMINQEVFEFLASGNPWIPLREQDKIYVRITQKFDTNQNKYVLTTTVAFEDEI